MEAQIWDHHSSAIISLLSGADSMQLQEIIADLNDLLNATLDEEQAQREADAAEWLAEESPFQVVGELEVDITLDGDVRMLPKEDNG